MDLVLDPMCGSGTTCKMAYLLNRNFIGVDVSKEYIEISKERLSKYANLFGEVINAWNKRLCYC